MKKFLYIILFLLITTSIFNKSFGQRNEIGITGGITYYLGDLNPSKHFLLSKPAGGIIYRYTLNERWAIKMNGIYGTLQGDDAKSKFNTARNLRFKSSLLEFSPQLELNFLSYKTGNSKEDYFTPYVFAGISVFSFNPKAEFNGEWYELKPFGTEGQGTSVSDLKPYSLTTISFPFGIGFKYSIGELICAGMEWGMRKTITDYIDDVSTKYPDTELLKAENGEIAAYFSDPSINELGQPNDHVGTQRGNSKTKDWYAYTGLFITFKIKTKANTSCPAYGTKYKKYKDFLKKD